MFLWFFVIPELLPHAWGLWIKQDMPCKEAAVAAWCLGCFTSARVAEQTRAGLESLSPGQLQAAQALGMGKAQALLQVLLPQALAMMLPALSSEAMSCVKNSSAAFAIGAFDIAFAARQMQEETAAPLEVFIAATCLYVALALLAKLGVACLGRLKSSRRRC
jgi:glutamate/aspartate transport system permease protein